MRELFQANVNLLTSKSWFLNALKCSEKDYHWVTTLGCRNRFANFIIIDSDDYVPTESRSIRFSDSTNYELDELTDILSSQELISQLPLTMGEHWRSHRLANSRWLPPAIIWSSFWLLTVNVRWTRYLSQVMYAPLWLQHVQWFRLGMGSISNLFKEVLLGRELIRSTTQLQCYIGSTHLFVQGCHW